ncbi:hypothetical protein ASD78_14385 [Lysobacter sp. Root667]|uniref:hypothetical protein n=1 Tax=Lysobacter sp. Root667 TaxID=1736581 RepID=UPI0007123BFE|nr:hypothetical protein [Lysobacter sp. Root667]KRA72811.1 hypothetical protein ASD78_14385 [Lysobacter sp. Root667]
MDGQLLGVLIGAAAASVVPLLTLRTTQAQWRLEKRIELLRRKKEDLERLYADIFQKLPAALQERSYPISMMGAISVHASPEVRKLYYDYMNSKDRDEVLMKHLHLEMTVAANKHVASVEKEIDQLLE